MVGKAAAAQREARLRAKERVPARQEMGRRVFGLKGRDIAELALLGAALPLYYLARGFVPTDPGASVARAEDLIAIEKFLGIFWEADAQSWALPHAWLTHALNAVYLWAHLPVIGAIALWLYVRRRSQYYLFRNAFLLSGVIGLVVYFTWPVAPPRLTPGFGFVDTITQEYGTERPGTPGVFINDYAAVPSLHFGWNVLAAGIPLLATRNALTWSIALLVPPLTLASILFTANHYILDAAAGLAAVIAGLAAALAIRRAARRLKGKAGRMNGFLRWVGGASNLQSPTSDI